jgi:hypothetical protein
VCSGALRRVYSAVVMAFIRTKFDRVPAAKPVQPGRTEASYRRSSGSTRATAMLLLRLWMRRRMRLRFSFSLPLQFRLR